MIKTVILIWEVHPWLHMEIMILQHVWFELDSWNFLHFVDLRDLWKPTIWMNRWLINVHPFLQQNSSVMHAASSVCERCTLIQDLGNWLVVNQRQLPRNQWCQQWANFVVLKSQSVHFLAHQNEKNTQWNTNLDWISTLLSNEVLCNRHWLHMPSPFFYSSCWKLSGYSSNVMFTLELACLLAPDHTNWRARQWQPSIVSSSFMALSSLQHRKEGKKAQEIIQNTLKRHMSMWHIRCLCNKMQDNGSNERSAKKNKLSHLIQLGSAAKRWGNIARELFWKSLWQKLGNKLSRDMNCLILTMTQLNFLGLQPCRTHFLGW